MLKLLISIAMIMMLSGCFLKWPFTYDRDGLVIYGPEFDSEAARAAARDTASSFIIEKDEKEKYDDDTY